MISYRRYQSWLRQCLIYFDYNKLHQKHQLSFQLLVIRLEVEIVLGEVSLLHQCVNQQNELVQ